MYFLLMQLLPHALPFVQILQQTLDTWEISWLSNCSGFKKFKKPSFEFDAVSVLLIVIESHSWFEELRFSSFTQPLDATSNRLAIKISFFILTSFLFWVPKHFCFLFYLVFVPAWFSFELENETNPASLFHKSSYIYIEWGKKIY